MCGWGLYRGDRINSFDSGAGLFCVKVMKKLQLKGLSSVSLNPGFICLFVSENRGKSSFYS